MNIDDLLMAINEDKHQNFTTTSNKFRKDLWEFFDDPEFKAKTCVEFGTHKGQTTRILSYLFKKVYTINKTEAHLENARGLNAGRDNIIYVPFDLYGSSDTNPVIDDEANVFFIDAGHERVNVIQDLERIFSGKFGDGDVYLVFDDYGMWPSVRFVVDHYLKLGTFTSVKTIGHEPGYNFGGNPPRILDDYEGIIVRYEQ